MTNAGQFTPGQPKKGGRRKGSRNKVGANVRELARNYTQDAVTTLGDIMNDKAAPEAARVMAADRLLDRGWGKAPQAITGPDGGPPVDVNLTVVRDTIARKLARIAATTPRLLETKADDSVGETEEEA
jgi:hypothetical protein